MRILVWLFCLLLLTGCSSLLTDVAKSAAGIDKPPGIEADANLDVGAAVQLGQENTNTKVSNKATDKRLVTNQATTNTTAENLSQSWSVPWWALLIAVIAGIFVDVLSMYERYKQIATKYN